MSIIGTALKQIFYIPDNNAHRYGRQLPRCLLSDDISRKIINNVLVDALDVHGTIKL